MFLFIKIRQIQIRHGVIFFLLVVVVLAMRRCIVASTLIFRENNAIYDGRLSKSFKNLQNGQRQTADAGLNQIIIIQKQK
jgi:hypothetical protein